MQHIAYKDKGSAPAETGLLGAEVQRMFDNLLSFLPHSRLDGPGWTGRGRFATFTVMTGELSSGL
jgi:hypothetical protein